MTFDLTGAVYSSGPSTSVYAPPDNVFDSNNGTYFYEYGTAPQWVQVQLGTAQEVTRYTIQGYGYYYYSPTAWQILGSNDGSTWATLDTRTGQSVAGVTSPVYKLALTGTYLYYRLNVTASPGSYILINDLSLDTTPYPVVINMVAASTLTAGVQMTLPVSQGVMYYVRALPATGVLGAGTLTWASTARVQTLVVAATPDVLDTTPATLVVSVGNGAPGDTVTFSIDSGPTIVSATLDSTGALSVAVPLPGLTATTHTVIATTNTGFGDAVFTVTNAPAAYPSTRIADTGPSAVTQTGVVRWVLQDPTTGGVQYIFPINPSKMSAPHAARVFATEHTTAPDGQPLTFEGSPVGVDWTMEGTCRTQEFHDALDDFLALPRRVYLIDHLSRAWTVTVETLGWTRLPEAYNDWAFTYQLKVIIYSGPVNL